MEAIRQQYRRLDNWLDNLSRIGFAVFSGLVTALLHFAILMAIGEPDVLSPLGACIGVTIAVYILNPQEKAK